MELIIHLPENTLAGASYDSKYHQRVSSEKWDSAYVFRESKGASLLISIRGKFCLERTRLPSSCDEYRTQCYDWSTDPVGRAI